ncbi:MAG TPA: type I-U CRISPR-associated protein Csb2 [Planctomycetaceae bacterium]
MRVQRKGSLDVLTQRHAQFLNRLQGGWTPVAPFTAVDQVHYRRDSDPVARPNAVFRFLDENDDTVAYPHAKLIHVAGMARHAAIELMTSNPPRDLRGYSPEQWVEQYVAGHEPRRVQSDGERHTQFSYVPLPSTGHAHADPGVRRVMVVAPLGDDNWLEHLAERLDGQPLAPLAGTAIPRGTRLERIPDDRRDGVRDAYTRESRTWASFTPVILPGHGDHKPDKMYKLILKALAQSGIEQPCEFEWSAFSQFPKSFSAHKYDKQKRVTGYVRPDHLMTQTAVHLTLHFNEGVEITGPLVIGAGRHCGFGLMAAVGQ